MANIGNITVTIGAETFTLKQQLKQAEGHIHQFTRKSDSHFRRFRQTILSARSSAIALGAVLALLGKKVLGGVTKEAVDFQKEMGKVNSLVKNSEVTFGELAQGVRNLSVEFGQSKGDLAKGLFDIISATVPVKDALDALRASSILSLGGFTDTAAATKAIIVTYQAFEDQLKDVSDAADFLFAIQERGILTVEDVSRTMGIIAATVANANIAIEDFGAAFAMISRTGVGAEKTVIQLQGVIDALTKNRSKGSEAIQIFDKLDIAMGNASVSGGELFKTFEKLQKATPSELGIIFDEKKGRRGGLAILSQMSEHVKDLETQFNRAKLSNNAASDALTIYDTKINRFKQSVNLLTEAFGLGLLDSITDATDKMTDFISSANDRGQIAKLAQDLKDLTIGFFGTLALPFSISDYVSQPIFKFYDLMEEKTQKLYDSIIKKLSQLRNSGDIIGSDKRFSVTNQPRLAPVVSEKDAIDKYRKIEEEEKRLEDARNRNRLLIRDFELEKIKLTKNSTQAAIQQFKNEAQQYDILVHEKLIKTEELEEFITESSKRIALQHNNAFQTMLSASKQFGDNFADMIGDWATGAEVTFENMAQSFGKMIVSMAAKIIFIQPLMESLFGSAAGGNGVGLGLIGRLFSKGGSSGAAAGAATGGAGIGGFLSKIGGGIKSFFGFAEGGVVPGQLGKPVPAVVHGGEMVIPPDRFPSMGGDIEINVYSSGGGTATTRERITENGGKRIDVLLDEQIADNISKTGTKTFNALTKTFSRMDKNLIRR